jgi:hypothetical protein
VIALRPEQSYIRWRRRYRFAPVAIAQTHAESDCPNRVCARKLRSESQQPESP